MKLGDPKEVGELMRKRRLDLGYTQEQMAEATGVSPITIMRIELGRVSYIHEKTARALEVPNKIIKRMVMTPVAMSRDGATLEPRTNALPRPMRERISGDIEATVADPAPTQRRDARKEMLRGKAHAMSPLKKLLLWAAAKV